jgi:predicted nucleotidyltransferase
VARGEANENSDLDLLVAWEPGRSLMDHAGLVQDLQASEPVKLAAMRLPALDITARLPAPCYSDSLVRRRRIRWHVD